eukprot:11228_6
MSVPTASDSLFIGVNSSTLTRLILRLFHCVIERGSLILRSKGARLTSLVLKPFFNLGIESRGIINQRLSPLHYRPL